MKAVVNRKYGSPEILEYTELESPNPKDMESSKIVPLIDKRYAFRDVADAIGYVSEGHARGKVVISFDEDAQDAGSPIV